MKIGIMQPYFFPYIGYFSLIKHTNRFILFDTVQFIKHGWIDRNRILKQQNGRVSDYQWQYISVPLIKYSRNTKIIDIKIKDSINWRKRIFNQLEHYKNKAPFYNETIKVVKKALDIQTNSIVKLNENILKVICEYLNIELRIDIFSEMNLEIDKANAPDEWALNICKAIGGVSEYWNPEGGIGFFDKNKYIIEGIGIKFLKVKITSYPQKREHFEDGLSIIDVMMFNTPEQINKMLDEYIIL